MRTIIIGDIHGCFQELTALLKKIDFHKSDDCLISLGDLIDRGEQSFEVFDLFCRLKMQMKERCVIIRGNHEQMMMDSYDDSGSELAWRSNGSGTTVKSFGKHRDNVYHHIQWFQENTVLYYTTEGFQCTHAGLQTDVIAQNSPSILLWDRTSLIENTYKGKLTVVGHTPIGEPTHFTGESRRVETLPYGQKRPLPATGIIGLDTGCVFKGKLTAMLIQDGAYRLESVPWTGEQQKTRPAGFWKRLFPN